jgi:hypothetical protein
MARAPIIDSPCPFRASRMPEPGRDHCGHCDRQVHNLDGMNTRQREAFLQGCSGKVCVAYTVHRSAQRRNATIGAVLVASLTGSGMAMAQDTTASVKPIDVASVQSTTVLTSEQLDHNLLLVGGVSDARQARWADEADLSEDERAALPEIGELEWLPSKP